MHRWIYPLIFVLFILMIPALACGIATITPNSDPSGSLSGEALRRTMQASHQASAPTTTPNPPFPVEVNPTLRPEHTAVVDPVQNTPAYTQPPVINNPGEYYVYYVRPGDTLDGVAGRFAVDLLNISSSQPLPMRGYLPHGEKLVIPNTLKEVTPPDPLIPDSELVYSPSAAGFNLESVINSAGGFLKTYKGLINEESLSGAEIVQKVAEELSVNPRLLLAILDYRTGWLYDQEVSPGELIYPLGFGIEGHTGLYEELKIAATQLNKAYYGWRQGSFTEIRYNDGTYERLNPQLNAGSAALQHLFAIFHRPETWNRALYGTDSFPKRYKSMLGDYWRRAEAVEPLIPQNLSQPVLELPFSSGEMWSLTAGPHESWNAGTPRGALDFSPTTGGALCAVSSAWVTASAPGIIVRSAYNTVALDLDGDGYEGSGFVLVYLHLAQEGLVAQGTRMKQDDPLGHPSCEGGRATGKHVHIARKYNGEWLLADGPVPFVMSEWITYANERNYYGTLVQGDQTVFSDINGGSSSIISH